MPANAITRNWKSFVSVNLIVLVLLTFVAIFTRLWVLTAIPIGFLFGFFLQKGNLCGTSAFSEVLLMKDWRKIWGIWVCIVTGMVGFALLDLLELVTLNPKPFIWSSVLVGGISFGIGMVLAGGCVSGCLFKAGEGNLNSMAALLGIALGVAMVEHGPLLSLHTKLKSIVIKTPESGPVTLSSLTGIPFWMLTLIFLIVTVTFTFVFKRKRPRTEKKRFSFKERLLLKSWKPWQAGLLIGLLGILAYLSSAASGRNYPLGVTHGVLHIQLLITDQNLNHVYQPKPDLAKVDVKAASESKGEVIRSETAVGKSPGKKVSWWLIALVFSLVLGSWISAKLSGEARLQSKPPEQVITAFIGGLLVGIGAAIATGCVIGNIISGWALMSVGSILFGIIVVLSNWMATYFYIMGGTVRELVSWVSKSQTQQKH